jgi:Domain of unknown function (DU1801)
MATSDATTVKEYLASLPPERRTAIEKVRRVIRKNLPAGFKEGMQYGLIGYYVPLSRLAHTYNGEPLMIAGLGSQKNYMSAYLMSVYGSPRLRRWFESEYRKSGKKLDMGKSCLRFRSVDDLPLDLIGQAIAAVSVDDYVATYEASRRGTRSRASSAKSVKAKPAAAKRKAASAKPRARAGSRTRRAAGRA